MERIKVSLPTTYSFSTVITIRITDLNYGGHVGNDTFLALAHEARVQFLASLGFTELNVAGMGLIMADAAIEYKRELVAGDELKISLAAGGFDKMGFDFYYLFEVKAGEEWLIAAKVKTGMVSFNYSTRKRIPLPQEAILLLSPKIPEK